MFAGGCTNRLDVVPVLAGLVASVAVVVIVDLMLLALLFGVPGVVAYVTLILKVVLVIHVLEPGAFRVEPTITPIAFVGRTLVPFIVAVILASLPRGERPLAGPAFVLPRHLPDVLSAVIYRKRVVLGC